jgi:hypothetical protein
MVRSPCRRLLYVSIRMIVRKRGRPLPLKQNIRTTCVSVRVNAIAHRDRPGVNWAGEGFMLGQELGTGLRSVSTWFKPATCRGCLSGKHCMLMGLVLFKIGVDGLNPANAGGSHKCLSHLTCLILPIGLCEILPLRKPGTRTLLKTRKHM